MFRRLNQRTASIVGTAIANAETHISHGAFASKEHGNAAYPHYASAPIASSSPAVAGRHPSARSFIKIKMVKSPRYPSNGEGGVDTNASSSGSRSAEEQSPSPSVSGNVVNSAEDDGYEIEWNSKDFYKRMGLKRDCTDKEIRARYIELAKRYHPDLASTTGANALPQGVKAEEVFKNIKEAYEALNNPQSREYINARGSEEYQERQQQGYGVSPEEYARQQAIKQLFTDGLPFFIASVGLFLFVMAYHFRSRINTSGIMHFIVILLVLSFLPRILAAAIMYLMHCNDMIAVFEKEAQAASIVTVTATQSGAPITKTTTSTSVVDETPITIATEDGKDTQRQKNATPKKKLKTVTTTTTTSVIPMNVAIRAEGIDAKHISEGNLVVTVKRCGLSEEAKKTAESAQTAVNVNEATGNTPDEEVFVFAKGVTAVTIPLVMPSFGKAAAPNGSSVNVGMDSGVPAPVYEMDVRFINDNLKLTLMEKKAFL